jgi:hypothetical protein
MPETTVLQEKTHVLVKVTTEIIVEALDHLPPEYLPDVLQFIQFLEYKSQAFPADHVEDEALWDAVQANQTYKEHHPDEELERYKSGSDFLKAMADL